MLGENKMRALEASVVVRHVFSCPGSHHSHMVSVAATTLPETMDAAVPTTPPSDSSSFDYSDDGRHDAAEQVLTNATLLKTILKFHTELRVRMVAVNVEDTPIARHANQAVQSAMDAIVQQHPQAHHTTVIRDYRPQHTLIEKLVSPDIVYSLLLANIQGRCAARVATMDRRLTHGLFCSPPKIEYAQRLRPRLSMESPFCPLPVRDMLYHEELQRWTCVQVSQAEILSLRVGEYQ